MSTYFLLDPIEGEELFLMTRFKIIPLPQLEFSKRKYVDIKCLLCLMKFALTKKCCLNIHILNFMILQLINIYIYIYIYIFMCVCVK